jgi:hypothetical protein
MPTQLAQLRYLVPDPEVEQELSMPSTTQSNPHTQCE